MGERFIAFTISRNTTPITPLKNAREPEGRGMYLTNTPSVPKTLIAKIIFNVAFFLSVIIFFLRGNDSIKMCQLNKKSLFLRIKIF